MRPMPRLLLTTLVMVAVAVAIVAIGELLHLDGPYYPIAFILGLFLVGLSDRDRFYGADLGRGER